jgi:hypothetical protein
VLRRQRRRGYHHRRAGSGQRLERLEAGGRQLRPRLQRKSMAAPRWLRDEIDGGWWPATSKASTTGTARRHVNSIDDGGAVDDGGASREDDGWVLMRATMAEACTLRSVEVASVGEASSEACGAAGARGRDAERRRRHGATGLDGGPLGTRVKVCRGGAEVRGEVT